MVSNCTWTSPALIRVGTSGVSVWMNASRSDIRSRTRSGGGATKSALPGRVPPIQIWERRNCFVLPRPFQEVWRGSPGSGEGKAESRHGSCRGRGSWRRRSWKPLGRRRAGRPALPRSRTAAGRRATIAYPQSARTAAPPADVHVKKHRGVGQDGGHAIEPADRAVRALELTIEPVHPDGRPRRQGWRHPPVRARSGPGAPSDQWRDATSAPRQTTNPPIPAGHRQVSGDRRCTPRAAGGR